jgi:8-oxo-dGTP pyrophosphatase MutT (NUDIX family)
MDELDTNRISKILIIKSDKVLLLMSKKLKKFHLPGGHIKKNETFTQGLNREVKEETNLKISWSKIIYTSSSYTLYKGGVYDGTIKLSDEHDGYIWAKIEYAHKYPLCKFTKRDIFGLQKYWKKHKNKKKKLDNSEEMK